MDVDFNNKYYGSIDLFGVDIWITDTLLSLLIISSILIIFTIYVNISIRKFKRMPRGFQNFIELIVELFDKFTVETMGENYSYFGFWFFGVIIFILCSNLSGLVGLRPPTADLAVTAAFGTMTFLLIHVFGIIKSKKQYFKDYISPNPIFFPINLIGEIATPVSLSFRLFGNILGGMIIMGMLYAALPFLLHFIIPPFLHIYFDIFSGVLQSYIFVILSMTFIAQKLPE